MADRLYVWYLRFADFADVNLGDSMRWLITTDGTARSQQAAEFAATLLHPEEDEIVLLGIINRTSKAVLESALDALEKILGGLPPRRIIQEGSVVRVIEAVACQEQYDVVVYASRGRRGLSRLLLGSVAEQLVNDVPCSVLIVRKPPEPLKKMLISTTLSEGHDAPIELGKKIAKRTGAPVHVLHVMSQITLGDENFAEQLQLTAEQAIQRGTREGLGFERILQKMTEDGLSSTPLIRYGLVEDEIVREVAEGEYDLVVLGAHSDKPGNRWQNFLIENVTSNVLFDTRCPVLVVRE
jgi:nucleotide-binding universal stress UspA family protein